MSLSLAKMETRMFNTFLGGNMVTLVILIACASLFWVNLLCIECVFLIIPLLLDTFNISFCDISEILGKSCKVCSSGWSHM